MKFRIDFKDPEGVSMSLEDAAELSLDSIEGLKGYEVLDLKQDRIELLEEFIKKWVEWREYIAIEFDTEAGTATVVEA